MVTAPSQADKFEADIAAISRLDVVPRILDVVCRTTGMGFAAVARVTEDRWIACSVDDRIGFGLKPGGELKIATTICDEVRAKRREVLISTVGDDPVYRDHPTPALYGFQSYISMPIVLADGSFFGTLCAIDPRPAQLDAPETRETLRLFADLIGAHLDAQCRMAASEASLLGERHTAELREQFIAVLGHDLRNPLAAIDAGTRLLERRQLEESSKRVVSLMQSSVLRMSRLIDDVLDFARGRLGKGLTVSRTTVEPLEPVLRQVAAELQAAWPERAVDLDFRLTEFVSCDHTRIGQLFSNLLGNALAYGATDRPVEIVASSGKGVFELSVTNQGTPIPAAVLERLFQPFSRGAIGPNHQGLGLGLYIAFEIARAHGGTLAAQSTLAGTCFTFRMACVPSQAIPD